MSITLREWQQRLEAHFSELYSRRGGRPLFALEHGLALSERIELEASIRQHVQSHPPDTFNWLPWIVYAAEIGYGYAGDVYWPMFGSKTPGWERRGSRDWIRDQFFRFHTRYGGAAPSGPWAAQFSIICWPITHAVLPLDLQRQLAQILFDLRDAFSADVFAFPRRLGEIIAAHSWAASSRFQQLVQETELVGQIASALLLQGNVGTYELMHPLTLQRITEDLEREQLAGTWFRGARQAARERANLHGLFPSAGSSSRAFRPEDAKAEVASLGIESRIVLRPLDNESRSWEVGLEVPDLSHLLLRFPEARSTLAESRCEVAGSVRGTYSRAYFLSGSQRIVLKRWPRANELLFRFEKRHPAIDLLLRTDCVLRPGPVWLFRIASDSLAYEVRSLRVRPGERYVVVRTSPIQALAHIEPARLSSDEVHAALITMPDAPAEELSAALGSLGLSRSRTVQVWPAGLTAAVWDGDGHGEWLATEQPCFGVSADHAVDTLIVSIASQPLASITLKGLGPGQPVFIELPRLPLGLHRIRFSSRRINAGMVEPIGDLDIVIRIREGRSGSKGTPVHGPIRIRVEPTVPTLEQIWEDRVEFAIDGPIGRHVKCNVALYESASAQPLYQKSLPSLPLPVDATTWASHFKRTAREEKKLARYYEAANVCELQFVAEELGTFAIRCERDYKPLRWTLKSGRGSDRAARLINDGSESDQCGVWMRLCESPLDEVPVKTASEYAIPRTGCLFVARKNGFVTAAILAPVIEHLGDLGFTPRFTGNAMPHDAIRQLCDAAQLWGGARVLGEDYGRQRQRDIVVAIDRRVTELLCGAEWIKTELAFERDEKGLAFLKRAMWHESWEADVAEHLNRRLDGLATSFMDDRIDALAEAARLLGAGGTDIDEHPRKLLAQFTLRLFSDPTSVTNWAREMYSPAVDELLRFPTFARAARFTVIGIKKQLNREASELHAGWRWS
jgi:hypothetical protein